MSAPTIAPSRRCACGRPVRAHHTVCGACESRVYRVRKAAGLVHPRVRVHLDDVVHLLASGYQLPEVARRLGVTAGAVRQAAGRRRAAEDAAIAAGEQDARSVLLSRLDRLLSSEATERADYQRACTDAASRTGGWWR